MNTITRNLAAAVVTLSLVGSGLVGTIHAMDHSGISVTKHITVSQVELRQDMRKLWEDHITWSRVYIIANVSNAAYQTAAATRLLQNQDDIGALFARFYGDSRGDQLAALLRVHILTAVDVINAAKANDQAALAAAN